MIRRDDQFRLGELLPPDALARRATLPLRPAPVILEGRFVRLEPLDIERDASPLHAVSNGEPARLGEREIGAYDAEKLIWRYLWYGPFAGVDGFKAYLQGLVEPPNLRAFAVFDASADTQVGVTTYVANAPEHLKIELGHIWYSPLVQGTKANVESAYLMLRHAFELGYRRVEWKCDSLNERSRRSALRIGFKFEGIQEAHYIIKDRNRDTAWFRMLDSEWPEARARLESLLYS